MENPKSRIFRSKCRFFFNLKLLLITNRLFNQKQQEFQFSNIDLKSLLTKTIEIAVWDKDFGKNDFIGRIKT